MLVYRLCSTAAVSTKGVAVVAKVPVAFAGCKGLGGGFGGHGAGRDGW